MQQKGAQTTSYYIVTRKRGVTINEVLKLLIYFSYLMQNQLITWYVLTPVSQSNESFQINCLLNQIERIHILKRQGNQSFYTSEITFLGNK